MPFSFSMLTEKQQMILLKKELYHPLLFSQKRSHGDEVESLTLKSRSFLMVLNRSILNNINLENRTRNKVVLIVSPKSPSSRLLRLFSIIFPCIRKSSKVWWRGLLDVRQLVNESRVYIKNRSLLRKTNKNELSKDTTKDTHSWLSYRVHSAYAIKLDWARWRTSGKKFLSQSDYVLYCSSYKHRGIIAWKNKFIHSSYVEITLNGWIDCYCCSILL